MPVYSFEDLRVWRSARAFKLAMYRLIDNGSLSQHARLREQLREAAAAAPSHLSEGFGRFDPLDNARFVRMAKASILECQNHLLDAVDRGLITEATRKEYHTHATLVLKELEAYAAYLQSPDARANAERLRRNRQERRRKKPSRPARPQTSDSDAADAGSADEAAAKDGEASGRQAHNGPSEQQEARTQNEERGNQEPGT